MWCECPLVVLCQFPLPCLLGFALCIDMALCWVNCCCSVTPLCSTFCDHMECSTPGLPVPHHLPKFAQVHVHCISDAIQPPHPLTHSSPLSSIFPSIRDFSSESAVHIRLSKYWSFSFSISPSNEYSGLISLKIS